MLKNTSTPIYANVGRQRREKFEFKPTYSWCATYSWCERTV